MSISQSSLGRKCRSNPIRIIRCALSHRMTQNRCATTVSEGFIRIIRILDGKHTYILYACVYMAVTRAHARIDVFDTV